MRCISMSAQKQKDIEIDVRNGIARVILRTGHHEVADETETLTGEGATGVPSVHWECEEAYMECADGDAPVEEEIEEDFEAWFEYIGDWKPEKQKTLAQLQADVEYIAAMSGIDLEV